MQSGLYSPHILKHLQSKTEWKFPSNVGINQEAKNNMSVKKENLPHFIKLSVFNKTLMVNAYWNTLKYLWSDTNEFNNMYFLK